MNRICVFLSAICMFFIAGCDSSIECAPESIYLEPLFGGVQKCEEQNKKDYDFIRECEIKFSNKESATAFFTNKAWEHYKKNENDSAMINFNRAIILDSMRADIYWGYASLLARKEQYEQSIPFFKKALSLDETNAKIWESVSNSYSLWFSKTNDSRILDSSIACLKYSLTLDTTSNMAYAQLTALYSCYIKKDSALKYLKIIDRRDSSLVNPEVRKILMENKTSAN